MTKLEAYCNPRQNEVLESHRFWSVKPDDHPSFEHLLTELRARAESCNFNERDRMLRDKIVFSTAGKLQELLLREENWTSKKQLKFQERMNRVKQTCQRSKRKQRYFNTQNRRQKEAK